MEKTKYLVIKRDTGSSKYGHDYKDCKIICETNDLAEAYREAVDSGYMSDEYNFGGVRILKEVEIVPTEAE